MVDVYVGSLFQTVPYISIGTRVLPTHEGSGVCVVHIIPLGYIDGCKCTIEEAVLHNDCGIATMADDTAQVRLVVTVARAFDVG